MKSYLAPTFIIVFFSVTSIKAQPNIRPVFPLQKLGQTIYEGVFTGNGLLGTMTYIKGDTALRIDFGRTDVYEHRQDKYTSRLNKARIPIGHIELLLTNDKIAGSSGQMDLQKANATATIFTKKGKLEIQTTTLAHRDLMIIVVDDSRYQGQYTLNWKPEQAVSTWPGFQRNNPLKDYPLNPEGSKQLTGNITTYKQPFLAGGGYAVAYKTTAVKKGKIIVASIGFAQQGDDYYSQTLNQVSQWKTSVAEAYLQHQERWNAYFARSVLRIPDASLQNFYQMQLYKLGCAARQNGPGIDLQGPWTSKTPWPLFWHNLNTQLTYSPVYTANHLEISQTLLNMIDKNGANLAKNVPQPYQHNSVTIGRVSSLDMVDSLPLRLDDKKDVSGPWFAELGNLTWLLYYYHQHYRYSMDTQTGNNLFEILTKSVNYYLHLLEKNDQGKYHVGVKTSSPEYPNGYGFDTNYDLAILRWGLKTLISLNAELNKNDPLLTKWSEVFTNLVDYPKNENGFMIAKDIPFAVSHRHYSHLLMIYPFYEINWERPQNRELINTSINHWQSMPQQLQGYSYTGLASMKAMMGDGDAAKTALQTLLTKFVKPNTLYAETGPVIETPLAAMASIQELCLQYWDGIVRVFPAIPTDWHDLSFDNFRTDGAFLISGVRKGGNNTRVAVKSEKGGRIKIKPNLSKNISWTKKGSVRMISENKGIYEFDMQPGTFLLMVSK